MTQSSNELMQPAAGSRTPHALDGAIRVLLANALFLPTGLLTSAFLTRRLGPEGYGWLTLATAVATWMEWAVLAAFDRATIKFVGDAPDWQPVGAAALRLQLLAGSGAGFLLELLAGPIATVLNEPALVTPLRLFALGIPAVALAAVHRQILVGLGDFTRGALMTAARWISRLLLIVGLVEIGLSVSGAILGIIGASLVEVAVARRYVRPSLRRGVTLPIRRLWKYAVPLFLYESSLRVFTNADLFLLKMLGGTAVQAGLYGAAQNLSMLPAFVVLSFTPLLLSTLGRALRDRGGRTALEIGGDALRAVIGLLPLVCVLAGAAAEIVGFIFGSTFLPAARLFSILIFGVLARCIIAVATTILTAAGRPGRTSALIVPLVPLAVVGHVVLIPRLGPLGAALVTTFLSVGGALAGFVAVYRLWGLLPRPATAVRSVVLCVPAYGVAALWPAPGPWLFLKLPTLGIMVLLGFVFLGEFSSEEMALARSLLSGRARPGPILGEG
jgi:O-antigen/teichoic acid export membrane protein